MSDQNRFFRWLWRFNAFLVAFAGIALIVMIAKDHVSFDKVESYVGPMVKLQPEKAAPAPKFFYYLSAIDPGYAGYTAPYIPGQNRRPWLTATDSDSVRLLPLMRALYDPAAAPEVTSSSFDPSMTPVQVNFLAIDGATGEGHWVFSGFDRVIQKYEVLTDAPKDPANAAAMTAVVIQVVEADTNKDGRRDSMDKQTLYVYHPGDKTAVKLFSADVIVDQGIAKNATYLITYEDGAVQKTAVYSAPDFKLLSEKTLPKLPE